MDNEGTFVMTVGMITSLVLGALLGQIITVVDVYSVCTKEGRYTHASIWFKEKTLTIQCGSQHEQKG